MLAYLLFPYMNFLSGLVPPCAMCLSCAQQPHRLESPRAAGIMDSQDTRPILLHPQRLAYKPGETLAGRRADLGCFQYFAVIETSCCSMLQCSAPQRTAITLPERVLACVAETPRPFSRCLCHHFRHDSPVSMEGQCGGQSDYDGACSPSASVFSFRYH